MASWAVSSIPDQTGRVAVVTGASGGLGLEAAGALAARGATVVLAVRDEQRGGAARERILALSPRADVSVSLLDLADLGSVRAFASREKQRPTIDILINNAGLGLQPVRAMTADGFERQFGTNYLGAFALTGLLLPALLRAQAPRVVAVSSIAHLMGRINFDDLQGSANYNGTKAYNQSKLSDLVFALELDRRARRTGSRLTSVAAHPGVAATGFQAASQIPDWQMKILNLGVGMLGQNATAGVAPILYAATMPDVSGGQYWGPDGFMELRGPPAMAKVSARARDLGTAAQLWAESERLTGVTYGPLDDSGARTAA